MASVRVYGCVNSHAGQRRFCVNDRQQKRPRSFGTDAPHMTSSPALTVA